MRPGALHGSLQYITRTNDHDDPPSHFMIQSSHQQIWTTEELPNLSEYSLADGRSGRTQRVRSVALAKPETAAHEQPGFRQSWLRSVKQNRWLGWIMHSLKFSITHFDTLCNMMNPSDALLFLSRRYEFCYCRIIASSSFFLPFIHVIMRSLFIVPYRSFLHNKNGPLQSS